MSAVARVLARTKRTHSGCLEYQGSVSPNGYGRATDARGKWGYAHRIVAEARHGFVPPGWVVDHVCGNRKCCNPDHLEVVTASENVHRGIRRVTTRRIHAEQRHDPQTRAGVGSRWTD